MDNPLVPARKLNKRQVEQLVSFTDPSAILHILTKNKWSVEESIEKLIDIAKGDVKESVKLGAIKYLNQLLLDAMGRAGLMVTAKSRLTDDDGNEITFTGRVVSKSLNTQKESFIEAEVQTGTKEITPTEVMREAKYAEEREEKSKDEETEEGQDSPSPETDEAGDIDMSDRKSVV